LNTYKRVGQILREAREERNLSVRDIAKETNIAMKFILALENEDYSQFPAETFALGFLKTYSDFLKLDTGTILQQYRGQQIEESQQPLQEITQPTMKIIALEIEKHKTILPFLLIGVVFIAVLAFAFLYDGQGTIENKTDNPVIGNESGKAIVGVPADINFIQHSIPDGSSVPFTLTPEQGFTFSANNQQCRIFIKSVKIENEDEKIAVIGFNVSPERKVFTFEIKLDQEYTLSYDNPELESLRREVKVMAQAITENSAKVQVSLSGERQGSSQSPLGDVPIQVSLTFLKSTYAEFTIDGQAGEKRLFHGGEKKELEARDRLELKVVDGSAVEMSQNGKEKVKLGKPGKLTKKVFFKVPSPYDNTQYIIKELGE
jgi:cytoskeletal protein RodZ